MHPKTIKELEELFSFSPPESLMRSIHQVFFTYLSNTEAYPEEHKRIVEDFYFLMKFLDKVEKGE